MKSHNNVKYVANSFLDTKPKEKSVMERNTKNARIVTKILVEENTNEESMKAEKSHECKICHNLFHVVQVGTFFYSLILVPE